MADAFQYKPRFKDIRIKPPKDQPSPEERVCDWPGCRKHGNSRAPKSNDQLNDFYWFCPDHAAEYNKSWNFFEGMSESAAQSFRDSAAYGHRPTWNWRSTHSTSARASKASQDFRNGFEDPYGVFGDRRDPHKEAPREQKLGRLQTKALETMGLEADCDKSTVRKRYAELLKRYHPDANEGDRSSEEQLGRVIAAYNILKSAGMA
ncbi:MAG: J domain-containing protein [Alphaproteobacteria bacterium]|nr:J domain-containing protein [Alphaproteobacteria bacterium]